MMAALFDRFIEGIIARLLAGKIISEADRPVYAWGLRTLLTQSAHMVIIVLLGAALGLVWESLLFLFTYTPLRVNAGGYHADDNRRCFTLTLVMDTAVLLCVKYLASPLVVPLVAAVCLTAIPFILYYAPVENAKKTLDILEQRVYAVRTRWIVGGIAAAMTGCFVLGYTSGLLVLGLSIFMAALMMWAGRRKNARYQR